MRTPAALRATTTLDLHDLRIAGAVMLGLAALLPVLPGPNGLPCPLRTVTGVPCPLCGMTTSVTATVHLHLRDAVAAAPAGVVAVLVAIALLAFSGRRAAELPVWVLAVALATMWVWQLVRFGML